MQHSPSVPWRALKAALGLGAAAAASLAFAGAANAAVIVITPDNNSGTDHLTAAINTANTNGSTSNTIVLSPGTYQPATQPITISKNLNLVGDHSFQASGGTSGINIQGGKANLAATNNLFQVNSGVTMTVQGMNVDGGGAAGFATFFVDGTLKLDSVTEAGPPGTGVTVDSIGTATLNNSTIVSDQQDSIHDLGSLTLNNDSIVAGAGVGIQQTITSATLSLHNTLLAFQVGAECQNFTTISDGSGTATDDTSCPGVQYGNDTNLDTYSYATNTNGGPQTTVELPANNPDTSNKGVSCPTTDERFFVNPSGTCDIGAVTTSATRETSPPSCTVTGGSAGPPKTQQVSLVDGMSGVGPELGAGTDNPSNTTATAYPPPAAVPIPGYSVSNLQINNGSVAFTPFSSPSTSPLVLTATKTTAGVTTQWSFTGLNWAGIAKNCY